MTHPALRPWIAFLLLAATIAVPSAAETPAAPETPTPTAEDFGWLAGAWRGTGLGGECEEIWSPPLADVMMGAFRLVRAGEVVFYELMLLEADAEGFALKLKHFSGDFTAWEAGADHVRFSLVEVAPGRATFEGLTMERKGDALTIRVRLKREGEEARWEPFEFRLQPAPTAEPAAG